MSRCLKKLSQLTVEKSPENREEEEEEEELEATSEYESAE